MDSLFENVTPSILIVVARQKSGNDGGWMSEHFRFLSMIIIPTVGQAVKS